MVKNLPAKQEMQVQSLVQKDTLVKEMATHSSILAWRIPWTEELRGTERVGHNSVTKQLSHIHYVISVCHSFNYPYINI